MWSTLRSAVSFRRTNSTDDFGFPQFSTRTSRLSTFFYHRSTKLGDAFLSNRCESTRHFFRSNFLRRSTRNCSRQIPTVAQKFWKIGPISKGFTRKQRFSTRCQRKTDRNDRRNSGNPSKKFQRKTSNHFRLADPQVDSNSTAKLDEKVSCHFFNCRRRVCSSSEYSHHVNLSSRIGKIHFFTNEFWIWSKLSFERKNLPIGKFERTSISSVVFFSNSKLWFLSRNSERWHVFLGRMNNACGSAYWLRLIHDVFSFNLKKLWKRFSQTHILDQEWDHSLKTLDVYYNSKLNYLKYPRLRSVPVFFLKEHR